MKKTDIKVLLLAAAVILSFSSCNKAAENKDTSNTDSDNVSVVSINENIDMQTENIKNKKYENLNFNDDFYVIVPDISQVDVFDSTPSKLSSNEAYALFDKYFDLFFGEKYKKDDKKILYHFSSPSIKADGNVYPDYLPLCKEYLDKINNNKIDFDFFVYGNKNGYLECTGYGLRSVFCGGTAKIDGYDSNTPAMYFATDSHNATDFVKIGLDYDKNKKYKMSDGEVTISEMTDLTESFLNDKILNYENPEFKSVVRYVKPVDMGNNTFGMSMSIVAQYKGIPFDAIDTEKDGFLGTSESSDKKYYSVMSGNVFWLDKDKPDYIVGLNIVRKAENVKTYDKIIGFEKAVDIIAESMSANTQLKVESTEFVYSQYQDNENDNTSHFVPSWKMTAYNEIDNEVYELYVNAVTGDFHYFTVERDGE